MSVFDYLLKPITYDDFMGSCQKVFESYMQDDNYNPIKRVPRKKWRKSVARAMPWLSTWAFRKAPLLTR